MRRFFKNRKFKYGSVALCLTLLVIAALILANTALSALAYGFGWYIDMSESFVYGIGEECEKYLEDKVFPYMSDTGEKIKIILCEEDRVLDDELSTRYVLGTVTELAEKYPDKVEIDRLNIWENPKLAGSYGITSDSDVVFSYRDRHITLTLAQFYVTTDGDTENPTAYNGERRVSSALLRVVREDNPTCYFTVNHGETLGDAELVNLMADAGYNCVFIDLTEKDIPDDCDLLLTVNPFSDLMEPSELSVVSETQKLEEYMSRGGKYMVFVSSDTFSSGGLDNFETFLEGYGVDFMHRTGEDGIENIYTVRDAGNAVSVDSYTFFSAVSDNPTAKNILDGMNKNAIFSSAAVISAAEGFEATSDGSYKKGDMTLSPIFASHASAEAWSGGFIADKANDSPFILSSLTQKSVGEGVSAYLYACASVEFCTEDALQSNVYGNGESILRLLSYMGKSDVPVSLSSRPLSTPPIQSLTTKGATVTTVLLCTLPVLALAGVGTFVLVRRKHL